ncbi:hypothetical protein B566_EDAN000916 [Ephemera danica]|nr:hypothetical protein B566_EDAN000916 [Ephemera danica]
MTSLPAHLSWMIIRNNNAFLMKKRNIKKPFSTEPNNLPNLCSFRYNGLIHKKTIGIEPATDNKGFKLVYKRTKNQVALRRASAVLKSQKPLPVKKTRAKKTE